MVRLSSSFKSSRIRTISRRSRLTTLVVNTCGTLKNATLFVRSRARSSRCCGLVFTQVKDIWLGCCAPGSFMTVWRQPGAPFTCILRIPLSCAPRNSAFGLRVRVISRHTYIHTYFSLFNQWNHWFVELLLSLTMPSSNLKLPVGQEGGRASTFRSQWRSNNKVKSMEIYKLSKIWRSGAHGQLCSWSIHIRYSLFR